MALLSLREYITEETKAVHHVTSFIRANPITTGHEKVFNKVRELADKYKAGHSIVLSRTHDKKKNPLTPEQKLKHAKRVSPGTNFETSTEEKPTLLHHLAHLHSKGVTHAHIVVGSDRVKEMRNLANTYNGKKGRHGYYNFKKITVHSAGHRDPDAEGSTGISGTKMREHAKNGDYHSFKAGTSLSDKHAKEMYNDVQKGMQK